MGRFSSMMSRLGPVEPTYAERYVAAVGPNIRAHVEAVGRGQEPSAPHVSFRTKSRLELLLDRWLPVEPTYEEQLAAVGQMFSREAVPRIRANIAAVHRGENPYALKPRKLSLGERLEQYLIG